MSSQRTPRREWNEKKAVILALSAGNSLKELAKLMREQHQFTATLAQYEYHLKEWNAPRKHLKRDDWARVVTVYDSLVSQHGTARVLVNNIPISTNKLNRNRRLYTSARPSSQSHPTDSGREAALPEAVSFQLQSADGTWLHLDPSPRSRVLGGQASLEATRAGNTMSAPDLPGPSFTGAGAQSPDEGDTSHWVATSPVNVFEPRIFGDGVPHRSRAFAFWETRDKSRAEQSRVGLEFRNAFLPHVASPRFLAGVSTSALVGGLGLSSHPDIQPFLDLSSPPPPGPLSRFGGIDVDAIAADCQAAAVANLRFENPAEILARQMRCMFIDIEKHSIHSSHTWRAYPGSTSSINGSFSLHGVANLHLPERMHGFGDSMPQQNYSLLPGSPFNTIAYAEGLETTVLNTDVPQWLVFALANNFAGLQNAQISEIIPWISRSQNGASLIQQMLRDKQNPRVKGMGASLLKACIEAQNVTAFRQMLFSGAVDIDTIVCCIKGVEYSILGRCAALQNLSLVQAVLEFQPNIAKLDPVRNAFGHLMGSLMQCDASISSDFEKIAYLLQKAGVFIDPELLFNPFFKRHLLETEPGIKLALDLASKLTHMQHEELIRAGSLRCAISGSQNEDMALRFVKRILDVCFRKHQWACNHNKGLKAYFEQALLQSAKEGYFGLVKVLLPFGISEIKYEFLLASISGGSKEVVDLALSQCPNLEALSSKYPKLEALVGFNTTALAAAILSKSEDLILVIKEAGCLEHLQVQGHFQAAITAASKARNLAQMQELFQHHPHCCIQDLRDALKISAYKNYDEITLALTDAYLKEYPLLQAALLRHWPVVHTLLISGPTDMQPELYHQRLMEWKEVASESEWGILFEHLIGKGDHQLILKAAETFPVRTSKDRHWEVTWKAMNREVLPFLCEHKLVSRQGLTRYLREALSRKNDDMVYLVTRLGADSIDQDALGNAVTHSPHLLSFLLSQVSRPVLEFVAHQSEGGDIEKNAAYTAIQNAVGQGLKGLPSLKLLFESGIVDLSNLRMWYPYGRYPSYMVRFCPIIDLRVAIAKTQEDFGNIAVVKYLLDVGCDPNTHELAALPLGPRGSFPQVTALLEAVARNHVGLVELLIEKGANINRRIVDGAARTPLQKAAELGYLDILKLLLDRGADVNAPAAASRGGGTALQLAAMGGNCAVLCELLERGADLSMPPCEYDGRWPLEGAAEHGRMSMIELLWEYCQGSFPDSVVDRAMELAEENGHMSCKEVLGSLRAKKRELGDVAGLDWTAPLF
ncbi:hypothetical protein GGTG_11818 [Gaeumannomyces tritici R3-111a-1]|uniref:Clr5 domain-containing protein n=1 Tax=Gaeumannomyces tritici (strain R3-111a-1) TaxID=644352 RepID=J3PE95_GAET3|nr:hypothetical protein GGTG_11818 [Gaeumannomyces tritici R3-111a-1]EJT70795.1 hypothetical protein GGTG_11818 [Gaeumannomyces tritici R3-111a-1]